jgi:hypothetical protein
MRRVGAVKLEDLESLWMGMKTRKKSRKEKNASYRLTNEKAVGICNRY